MDTAIELLFTAGFLAGTIATIIFIGMAIADDFKKGTPSK
jgi:hypothetical protein